MDAGEVSGEFVVAGGDGTKMLEFVEEALDQVPLAVEGEVARKRGCPPGMGGNHRANFPLGKDVDEGVGIVRLVADQGGGIGIGEQWLCANEIVGLSWRKHQLDGIA